MSGGGQDALCQALCAARDGLSSVLDDARAKFAELGSSFAEEGIFVLLGAITIYEEFFKRVNIEDNNALELAIAKGPKTVKEAACGLLDVEDEWNRFLGEIENKENDSSTLVDVGDEVPENFTLLRVTHPSDTTAVGDDDAPNAEILEDILRARPHNNTLFVFNRHFA